MGAAVSDEGYRVFQPADAPTWLQDQNGQAWLQAFGLIKDLIVDRVREGSQQRFPGLAAPDALGVIGSERGGLYRKYSGDTDEAYAQRLINAWETWKFGGTALGMLRALDDLGYTVTIQQSNGLSFRLDGTADRGLSVVGDVSWLFLGSTSSTFWTYFTVVFELADIPPTWTSIVSPPTGLTAPTLTEVNLIRSVISRFKYGPAVCAGIHVNTVGGKYWGKPALVWGAGGLNWGGNTVVTFTP